MEFGLLFIIQLNYMLDPHCTNYLNSPGKKETKDLLCAILLMWFKLETLNILFSFFFLI